MIEARNLTKSYPAKAPGASALQLFANLNFTVPPGEMLAIVGQSGSGKSSLLHLLAALDTPTSGTVEVDGIQVSQLTPKAAAAFRNTQVGYVWQFHYLMPEFTALENIAMPLLAAGAPRKAALARAQTWLAEVGLANRAAHRSGELSGGEQQRISLARALVTHPKVLLADEPTGDLDPRTAEAVFTLLERLHQTHALTSVLVTHSFDFAARCTRTLTLRNGQLSEGAGTGAQGSALNLRTEPLPHDKPIR